MRFLILSDTHSAHLPSTLPACDVLLHCGDTTADGTPPSISKALQSLGQIDAELKLVIAGTHEISLDKAHYTSESGSLEDANSARATTSRSPDSEASDNGVMHLQEGTHTFTLSHLGLRLPSTHHRIPRRTVLRASSIRRERIASTLLR